MRRPETVIRLRHATRAVQDAIRRGRRPAHAMTDLWSSTLESNIGTFVERRCPATRGRGTAGVRACDRGAVARYYRLLHGGLGPRSRAHRSLRYSKSVLATPRFSFHYETLHRAVHFDDRVLDMLCNPVAFHASRLRYDVMALYYVISRHIMAYCITLLHYTKLPFRHSFDALTISFISNFASCCELVTFLTL